MEIISYDSASLAFASVKGSSEKKGSCPLSDSERYFLSDSLVSKNAILIIFLVEK